ncbi:MAG TPA: hypothetical protein VFR45_05370 [Nocardioides sp.]|nr:hypothetical protein [Nocardioides sp.]
MSLPSDFAREISDHAPQPGFDAVVDRARIGRRRRRTTVASGLAAAVVAAGIGVAVGDLPGGDASPEPANPTRTSDVEERIDAALPEGVRHVLGRDEVQAWDVSAADGVVAAFWRACGELGDPCQHAWTLRDGDEVTGGLIDAQSPVVTVVPDGWLIDEQRGSTLLLTPDGEVEQVGSVGDGGTALGPDDAAVLTSDGSRLLRDGALVAMPEPPDRPVVGAAYVAPGGRLVAATSDLDGWGAQATDDGRTWEEPTDGPPETLNVQVAGSGDHVAVMFIGAGPDRSVGIEQVIVSSDAGRTWTTAHGLDTKGADRSLDPYGMTVAPDGTTYLTTETEGLVRIDPDGGARAVPVSSQATSVFAHGDDICVVAKAGAIDQIQCSSDGGTTWAPQPLPGLS